jgi:hypothetical protein
VLQLAHPASLPAHATAFPGGGKSGPAVKVKD